MRNSKFNLNLADYRFSSSLLSPPMQITWTNEQIKHSLTGLKMISNEDTHTHIVYSIKFSQMRLG